MEKKLYERAVHYYETDKMQIVHHSNYIKWFEEARLKYMEESGIPYEVLEKKGILIPVMSVSAVYRMAFQYGDIFQIDMKITKFNGLKMNVCYEVFNKKTGVLSTTGETSHCFLDQSMKPIRMKRDFPDIYQTFYEQVLDKV